MCIGWKIINSETGFFFLFGMDVIFISNFGVKLFSEGHFAPECFSPECFIPPLESTLHSTIWINQEKFTARLLFA